MSNVLGHRFVSPKLDGADATQVQPSAWNDGHRFSGGAAGDVLTRDPTDATFGATWAAPVGWVPYTPLWYLGGVVTAPGTHTISASYHRRGNAIWFQVLFSVGAGALPAGSWAFGFPAPSTGLISAGAGMLYAAGIAFVPLYQLTFGVNDRAGLFYSASGTLTEMTGTAPHALVAGAAVDIRGYYQAA